MSDQIGTVEVGRLADLVILNANPLGDVRNLRRVHGVVKAGNFFHGSEFSAEEY